MSAGVGPGPRPAYQSASTARGRHPHKVYRIGSDRPPARASVNTLQSCVVHVLSWRIAQLLGGGPSSDAEERPSAITAGEGAEKQRTWLVSWRSYPDRPPGWRSSSPSYCYGRAGAHGAVDETLALHDVPSEVAWVDRNSPNSLVHLAELGRSEHRGQKARSEGRVFEE